MNLKDVQSGAAAGISTMTLTSFLKEEGQYGQQICFVFTGGKNKDGEDVTTKWWYALRGGFAEDKASLFVKNLQSFIGVLETVDPNAYDVFQELKDNSGDFDNNDNAETSEYEYRFIKKLVEPVIGKEVKVVRHYNDKGYLNIPKLKENDWNLPFGKNPIMGPNLRMTKPVQAAAVTTEETDTAW